MIIENYLGVLWRRKWVVLLVVLVALVLVAPSVSSSRNQYAGAVKLLVTLPETSTVDLYSEFRSSSVQAEVNLARNNFADLLKGSEVRNRTIEALALSESLRGYELDVKEPRDTEFLIVNVKAPNSVWAAEIANAHVDEALAFFGEIRARPAASAKEALSEQLEEARIQQVADEQAVLAFDDANRISSLDAELNFQETVLADLYLRRNRYSVEGSDALALAYREIIQILEDERLDALKRYQAVKEAALQDVIDLFEDNTVEILERYRAETAVMFLASVEPLIEREEEKLTRLRLLRPQLEELESQLARSERRIQQLSDAHLEASTKEEIALKVNFIHVVLPATPVLKPDTRTANLLLFLTIVGSVGIGVVLAFGVDYFMKEPLVQKPLPSALAKQR